MVVVPIQRTAAMLARVERSLHRPRHSALVARFANNHPWTRAAAPLYVPLPFTGGTTTELAAQVVDGSSRDVLLEVERRCRVTGLTALRYVDGAASPLVPVMLIARDVAPLLSHLAAEPRVAPTFACVLAPESDATRVELLVRGATDVFFTDDATDFGPLVAHARRYREAQAIVESSLVTGKFGGNSVPWLKALHELVGAARADCAPLLLLGETGTGKDGAARLFHEASRVPVGELVVVHCGAIVPTLSGSELFGHRRGAFSGADRDRDGAIARAHGGTLFLDEVAELSPALQTELLRVLQDGTYRPVGEDRERVSRFRLVAATHKDLAEAVTRGAFREDLYFRLRAAEVRLPPLRQRPADVMDLVDRFAREFLGDEAVVEPALHRALQCYRFPGNVRELKALIRVASSRCPDGKALRLACLPASFLTGLSGASTWSASALDAPAEGAVLHGATFNEFVDAAKDALVRAALGLARGSVKEASQRLSVSERCVQLRRKAERASASPAAPEGDEGLETAV